MALEVEKVEINGVEYDAYKIDGHPVEDLIILKRDLAPVDEARLQAAAGGELKDRDLDEITINGEESPVAVSGTYLNLLQARLKDINKWGSEYFSPVLVSTEVMDEVVEKADIANHTVEAIYDLRNVGGGNEFDPAPLNDKIQKLEARIKALEDKGE